MINLKILYIPFLKIFEIQIFVKQVKKIIVRYITLFYYILL